MINWDKKLVEIKSHILEFYGSNVQNLNTFFELDQPT